MSSRTQFGWMDSPDGEDIIQKINLSAKIGCLMGMPIAIFDHFGNPQKNMKGYGFRAAAFVLPMIGAGAAFGLVSQSLCKAYPKTKPEIWYAAGGVASATVLGAACKKSMVGAVLAFYLGTTAYLVRDMCNFEDPGFFGLVPTVLNNDDELLAGDYRLSPPRPMASLPLPLARPSRPHSDLGLY